MKTYIYLVRHAHSEYSLEHEKTRGLSEQGQKDAETVTKLLSEEGIQIVCSSPYTRAVQTVEGIAKILGVHIKLDERFRERNFAGHDYLVRDRMEVMERGFIDPVFVLPGGESNREVEQRGISAMNDVLQEYAGKRIAIGIHGGIMTILMRHYDARFGAEFLRKLPKPAIYKLSFEDKKYISVQRIGVFGDATITE